MKALNRNEIVSRLSNEKIDYFISSSSFEERCLDICSIVAGLNINIDKCFLFGTVDFMEEVKVLRNKMLNLFSQEIQERVKLVDLKINDPVSSFVEMLKVCNTLFKDTPKCVLLDITTFTHENLLVIFRILYTKKRESDKVLMIYSGAKSYSHNYIDNKDKWLTKGIKEIRSVIGYPGYFDPTKKNHLIILFGIEIEKTIKLIELFEFDTVSIGIGSTDDSISDEVQIINKQRCIEILNLYTNAKTFEFSLTDTYLTKSHINEHISYYPNENIVIVPMNNKISTIGVGLAAIENQEIQIFYMQANLYNTVGYSQSSGKFYINEIQEF
jgi:hypothetical protein